MLRKVLPFQRILGDACGETGMRVLPTLSCALIQIGDSFLTASLSNFTGATYVMMGSLLSLYYSVIYAGLGMRDFYLGQDHSVLG